MKNIKETFYLIINVLLFRRSLPFLKSLSVVVCLGFENINISMPGIFNAIFANLFRFVQSANLDKLHLSPNWNIAEDFKETKCIISDQRAISET